MSPTGRIKYKAPIMINTIVEIEYPFLICVSNIIYPNGLKKRVRSNNFNDLVAILPEILFFNELFLNKLYLSTQ